MNDPQIRDIAPEDFDRILALNEESVQWTSPMDGARLEQLVSLATYRKVLVAADDVAGFLLAMGNDCGYENDNFDWFSGRYANFLYVDRIVIASEYAGRGYGKAFYADLFGYAGGKAYEQVVCEFNALPLNEVSKAFHATMGFVEVGTRQVKDANKVLSMQARPVPGH